MTLELNNRLQEHICRNWIRNHTYNTTDRMKCDIENMVFSNTSYPFTRHQSPYLPAVNKMPSFCAVAKEQDILSFELHSNMLDLH